VLISDALGHLLEAALIQGRVHGISVPNGLEMVNNHLANYSILSVCAE